MAPSAVFPVILPKISMLPLTTTPDPIGLYVLQSEHYSTTIKLNIAMKRIATITIITARYSLIIKVMTKFIH